MAAYYITGVWKDANETITHYAFHLIQANGNFTTKATKTAKSDAIRMIEAGDKATTLVWDYTTGGWNIGQPVSVAGSGANKYLKSAPDKQVSDNLGHLICWNCFI